MSDKILEQSVARVSATEFLPHLTPLVDARHFVGAKRFG